MNNSLLSLMQAGISFSVAVVKMMLLTLSSAQLKMYLVHLLAYLHWSLHKNHATYCILFSEMLAISVLYLLIRHIAGTMILPVVLPIKVIYQVIWCM